LHESSFFNAVALGAFPGGFDLSGCGAFRTPKHGSRRIHFHLATPRGFSDFFDVPHICQLFELPPNRVWRAYTGGKLLDGIEGKAEPCDSNFPEDWIGSATRAINAGREDLDEGAGIARGADGVEARIDALLAHDPVAFLGPAHVAAFGVHPQLLVKYLDSAVRLHLQAHPSVAWSRRHLDDDKGKTEAWWILGSRGPHPYVYIGFQRPPTPEAWGRMMKDQDIAAMLACFDRIPVAPGEVFLIPGGTPHAIGEGLLLLEVQEPTDYVVKTEFEVAGVRLDEQVATMRRGVEGVLDLFDYTAYSKAAVKDAFGPRPCVLAESEDGREEMLLGPPQTDRFELRRIEVGGTFQAATDARYSILIVLEGEGVIRGGGRLALKRWSKVLAPACLEALTFEGNMTVARCLPPSPPVPVRVARLG